MSEHARGAHRRPLGWRARLLPPTRREQIVAATLGAVLVIAGIVAVIVGLGGNDRSPPSPSRPAAAAPAAVRAPSTTHARSSASPTKPFHCGPPRRPTGSTTPTQICIPTIRVDATVMRLGLNHDRTVEVPPLSRVGDAGWYKYSAHPGAVGPTVILGHVDSAQYGEGVFFKLSRLHPGDTVRVARGDAEVATYRVDRVAQVSKQRFPTQAVYGATSGPALRLVTCGGKFDAATGNYEDNIIAYGTLESLRKA